LYNVHYKAPPWLLRSRITPPSLPEPLVERPRLTRLIEADSERFVTIEAPAGFGKSVLAAQWSGSQTARRCAWLSLGAADVPSTVLHYLLFAVREAALACDGSRIADDELDTTTISLFLQSILGWLERTGNTWCLVLNDAQNAQPEVINTVIEPLLSFKPANLKVLLTTRTALLLDPKFSTGPYAPERIDADTLIFDHEETRAFMGPEVTAAQARQFLKLTSGWPVLMQLLRPEYKSSGQWLKRSDARIPAAAAEFIARHLSTQLDETRHNGLRKLALLPGFDTELASELVEPAYTSELVETLVREKLLVRTSSFPGAGERLIVQPLMRAWLLQDLSRNREPWITTGRQLAIRRYLQEDHTLQAVRVAVESGDQDLLVETVESIDLVYVWMMSGLPQLRRILSLLPAALTDTCPRVAYARVVYLIKCGRLSEANRLFDAATRMNRESPRQRSGSPPEETVEWHLCRSMLSIYRGTPMSYPDIQAFEDISMEHSTLQPVFRALTSTLKCYVHQQRGKLEDARNEAWVTIGTAKQAHSDYLAYYMYCDLGIIHGLQGEIGNARKFFESGDSHCRQTLRDDERLAVIRDTFRLELEHELDPLDNSNIPRLRNICRRLHQLEGWPDVFAAAFKTYSEKLCFEDNLPAAIVTIDAGLQFARDEEMIGLVTILASQRAILSCLGGDPADAAERLETLLSSVDLNRFFESEPWREAEAIAEACAVLDRVNQTSRYHEPVHAALEWFRKCGNLRSSERLDCLLTPANPGAGNPAADLQKPSKFRRGEILRGRIDEARRRLAGRQLPDAFPASVEETGPAYFTEKETAVLVGLCKGWSDKQIARELGISAHGVRYHLKKIYDLMNIRNRNEVRDRIQQLDLLGRQRNDGPAPQTEPETTNPGTDPY